MYVRLVRFSFGPGKRAVAQALADDLVPAIREQTGCQSVTAFGDDRDGEYGLVVQWDSQEHADAAAAVISPRLQQLWPGTLKPRRIFACSRFSPSSTPPPGERSSRGECCGAVRPNVVVPPPAHPSLLGSVLTLGVSSNVLDWHPLGSQQGHANPEGWLR